MRCLKIPKKSSNESRLDASLCAYGQGSRTRWETGRGPLLGFRVETNKPADLFWGKASQKLERAGVELAYLGDQGTETFHALQIRDEKAVPHFH